MTINNKLIKKDGFIAELKKNKILFLMLSPAIIYFIIFCYLPMIGIAVAFESFRYDKGILHSPWVGIDNFKFFFISGKAWLVTKNTILYNAAFIFTGLIFQLTVAIIFSELKGKYFKKITQSMMFLPYFISWVVVGAFVYNLFQYEFGSFNSVLKALNLQPVDVYGTPGYWKYLLVIFNLWKYIGYGSVVYLAAIMGISPELYEAAEMDGASILQRIYHITIPMIKTTIIILILLQIGGILRGNFDLFYQMVGNNGLLFNATDVIDTFVFRSLMKATELGQPAAAGLYQQALGFCIIMGVNFIVKKVNEDYSLF
jgi:putative aldouronate transport system permease protein